MVVVTARVTIRVLVDTKADTIRVLAREVEEVDTREDGEETAQ